MTPKFLETYFENLVEVIKGVSIALNKKKVPGTKLLLANNGIMSEAKQSLARVLFEEKDEAFINMKNLKT